MAVEARHLNPFPSQLNNRNPIDVQANIFFSHNTPMPHSQQEVHFISNNNNNPFAAAATRLSLPELNQSSYNPDMIYRRDSSLQATKPSSNTDQSGLISYINSRKRTREAAGGGGVANDEIYYYDGVDPPRFNSSAVLVELDPIISQHTKKIRLEMEKERQKQKARLLLSYVGEGILMKRLREKEAQILKMGKINLALQEKVKSLCVENQLWRDLAEANEATANSLRSSLEQLLSSLQRSERAYVEDDDAESSSCCGSSDDANDVVRRPCKLCGGRESCVVVLPCRHLCLCGGCGGGSRAVTACPVCSSGTNGTLHVNMGSS